MGPLYPGGGGVQLNLKEGRAILPGLGADQPIFLKVDARARRFKGAMREGLPWLVIPKRATKQDVLRALDELGPWFVTAIKKVEGQKKFLPDGHILVRGHLVPLLLNEGQKVPFILTATGLQVGTDDMEIAESAAQCWLYRQAEREILASVADWSAKMHLKPKSVRVSETFSKWGSCTKEGALSFSWRQIMAPPEILEYLVVHELSHIRHPHHQASFWKEVDSFCPYWRAADLWLGRRGPVLMNLYPRQSLARLKRGRPHPPIEPGQLEPFTRLLTLEDKL